MRKIHYVESLGGTDVMTAIHLAHTDMIHCGAVEGRGDGYHMSGHAFYMRDEAGKIIALIKWSYDETIKEVWIAMSWTSKAHRRQGLNAALYARLKKAAAKLRAKTINGAIAAKNVKMIEAAKKQGRHPHTVIMVDTL